MYLIIDKEAKVFMEQSVKKLYKAIAALQPEAGCTRRIFFYGDGLLRQTGFIDLPCSVADGWNIDNPWITIPVHCASGANDSGEYPIVNIPIHFGAHEAVGSYFECMINDEGFKKTLCSIATLLSMHDEDDPVFSAYESIFMKVIQAQQEKCSTQITPIWEYVSPEGGRQALINTGTKEEQV